MVTIHAEKCFKALINSGATISVMHTSVYNMIEDHYKTSILPTAVNLRTAEGSPVSLMGKATLYLWIALFKFLHTFIICNRLLEADFLFCIDLQKQYALPFCWDSNRHFFIQREGFFLTYTRKVALVKSTTEDSL